MANFHARRRITLLAGIFFVCLLVYLVLPLLRSTPALPRQPIRITFVGYTNDLLGRRRAAFAVSNMTIFPLRCLPVQLTPVGGIWQGIRTTSIVLKPTEGTIQLFPLPTNGVPWRCSVSAFPEPLSLRQKALDNIEHWLPPQIYLKLRGGLPSEFGAESETFDQSDNAK